MAVRDMLSSSFYRYEHRGPARGRATPLSSTWGCRLATLLCGAGRPGLSSPRVSLRGQSRESGQPSRRARVSPGMGDWAAVGRGAERNAVGFTPLCTRECFGQGWDGQVLLQVAPTGTPSRQARTGPVCGDPQPPAAVRDVSQSSQVPSASREARSPDSHPHSLSCGIMAAIFSVYQGSNQVHMWATCGRGMTVGGVCSK